MNPDALVRVGYPPWAPSPDAHSTDIWHEYDMPTVGVFRLGADSVLFTVVGDPDSRLTVWAYTCLDAGDAERLAEAQFSSVDELSASVESRLMGREVVFAIADNLQIWRWGSMRVETSTLMTSTRFLRQVRESLANSNNAGTQFRVALAGVEAAKDELVSV
jgi:hypothetical protein